MKIGLNATCFNDRPSGANQRFFGIYSELIKQLPDDEFVIYEPVDYHVSEWFNGAENVSTRQTPIPSEGRVKKTINSYRYWGTAFKNETFDLFESFHLPLIKSPTGRILHTIHDIRGLYDNSSSVLKQLKYKFVINDMLKKADNVITVSQSVKNEILSFYPEASVSVVHNGVNAKEYEGITKNEQEIFKLKYNLPSEFLLAVGHFEKRKNYLNLIESIARLHKEGRHCHLLIIGNDSGEGKLMREKISGLNLSSAITILSGLSDLEVRCAYKLCTLFVFPSSYEGFGIPILEAMAANVPIVLSDIPVFREITQGKGIYFQHSDPNSITCAIDKVLSSENEKNSLIEYGNKRVQDFSFKKIASDLTDVYKFLL